MIHQNTLSLIGNTPIIELERYSPSRNVKLFAKLENFNPSGSVKDRPALFMINSAEKSRKIVKGQHIIEATSGNTGISLAMISALKGYKFTAVMPENSSFERQQMIRLFDANIILTDGKLGTNYSIEVAQHIISENSTYMMMNQFENQANVVSHYHTTASEIIQDIPNITNFIAGAGTGGTLIGNAMRLKKYNHLIQIVGIEPEIGTQIPGLRSMKEYIPPIYKPEMINLILKINDSNEAINITKDLNKSGLPVGLSSGAALWGAILVAREIKKGFIVVLFPDSSDRYLSML